MSSEKRVKLYKNSERDKPEVRKSYVPQYQIMGVEPEEFVSSSNKVLGPTPKRQPVVEDTLRTRASKLMQPYAKMVASPIGHGRGLVPNVGNNMEHTWSSVDGEIVDDLSETFEKLESDEMMIDNNDVMTPEALGIKNNQEQIVKPQLSNILNEGYSLFVLGDFVSSGSLEEIQEQVKMLVFGEHYLYESELISVDNISVFKIEKVKIKVGVFLE